MDDTDLVVTGLQSLSFASTGELLEDFETVLRYLLLQLQQNDSSYGDIIKPSLFEIQNFAKRDAIVLLGATGAGKSTLINELLNFPLLPTAAEKTDAQATTSIATEIRRVGHLGDRVCIKIEYSSPEDWLRIRQSTAKEMYEGVEDPNDEEVSQVYSPLFEATFGGQEPWQAPWNQWLDWKNHINNLRDTTLLLQEDPVYNYLSNLDSRFGKTEGTTEEVKTWLKKNLLGPNVFTIKRLEISGGFNNSYLPNEISLFDLPGGNDPDVFRKAERKRMIDRARSAIFVIDKRHNWATSNAEPLQEWTKTNDKDISKTVFVVNRATVTSTDQKNFLLLTKRADFKTSPANTFVVDSDSPNKMEELDRLKAHLEKVNKEKHPVLIRTISALNNLLRLIATSDVNAIQDISSDLKVQTDTINAIRKGLVIKIHAQIDSLSHEEIKQTIEMEALKQEHHHMSIRAFARKYGSHKSSDVAWELAQLCLKDAQGKWPVKTFSQSNVRNAMEIAINDYCWKFYGRPSNNFEPWFQIDDFIIQLKSLITRQWDLSLKQYLKQIVENEIYQQSQIAVGKLTAELTSKRIVLPFKDIKQITERERAVSTEILKAISQLHKLWTKYYPQWQWSPEDFEMEKKETDNVIYFEPSCIGLLKPDALFAKLKSSDMHSVKVLSLRFLCLTDQSLHFIKDIIKDRPDIQIDISGNLISPAAKASLNTSRVVNLLEFNVSHANVFALSKFTTKRYAIVIGNSDYEQQTCLKSSIVGADTMRTLALRHQFNIYQHATNELRDQNDWNSLIEWVTDKLHAEHNSEVLLFFFFAGHGCTIEQTHCIAGLNNTIFPLTKLFAPINQHPNCSSLIILDACQTQLPHSLPLTLRQEAGAAKFPKRLFLTSSACPLDSSFGYGIEKVTPFVRIHNDALSQFDGRKRLSDILQDASNEYFVETAVKPSILTITWPFDKTL